MAADLNALLSDESIHRIISPLIAYRGDREEFVSGTAFIVARGYALTAYHVLSDFVHRYEALQNVEDSLNISFQIALFVSIENGTGFLPLKVMRVWRAAPFDIAVLALGVPENVPDSFEWKLPILNLRPPKVGERITAFGFPNPEVLRESSGVMRLQHRGFSSSGLVREVHAEKRDAFRLPFPCFQFNARLDGGMSGGPIFNEAGNVCGIACSSLPANAEEEEHVSYGATLWPIIGIPIDAGPLTPGTGSYYPLMRLFESNIISACDIDKVKLSRCGTRVSVQASQP